MRVHRYLPVAILLVIALAFTGCGSKKKAKTPEASGAEASPVTAQSVLSDASARWSQTQSAHFNLTIDGKAYLDSDQTLRYATPRATSRGLIPCKRAPR